MSATRNKIMEKAKSWSEVAPSHQRKILQRLASLGDGYHFAGELGMEAYVKLAIVELKRAAAEPEAKACEKCGGSGTVYETVTSYVLGADGRDSYPVDHNTARVCPGWRR